MEEINVGDIVYLKTGSRKMIVKSISNEIATCLWEENGKDQIKEYELFLLTKIDPNNFVSPISMG